MGVDVRDPGRGGVFRGANSTRQTEVAAGKPAGSVSAEAPEADVTVAVVRADFRTGGAESDVRWVGPRGVEVESELES